MFVMLFFAGFALIMIFVGGYMWEFSRIQTEILTTKDERIVKIRNTAFCYSSIITAISIGILSTLIKFDFIKLSFSYIFP